MAGGGAAADEGGGKTNVFGESPTAPVELNLTALMDILSNLLFFLLASFGATIVMSINATVPVQSAEASDVADKKDQVTVNLNLAPGRVDISAAGSAQTEDELARFQKSLPAIGGEPDVKGVAAQLLAIKQAYTKSDTVLLTPEPGVSYAQMIAVMDASREMKDPAGGRQPLKLFPTVVVSTVVK